MSVAVVPLKDTFMQCALLKRDHDDQCLSYSVIMEAFADYIVAERPFMDTPAMVAQMISPLLLPKPQEELWILNLNHKNRLIGVCQSTVGLLNSSQVHAREVFRQAIVQNAARIILVHQHPSGDPTPSQRDIETTKKLKEAGAVIGIEVIDHVVLGERQIEGKDNWVSIARLGIFGSH
jgi:DNA repair protein RadC